MLAEKVPEIDKAASSIWQLSEEDVIKEQLRRRMANEHLYEMRMEKLRNAEKRTEELEDRNDELEDRNVELLQKMSEKDARIAELERLLAAKG